MRALIARDLIRRGESVHLIEVRRGGVVGLVPAGSWDVRGGWDPESWWYRLDLFGPVRERVPVGSLRRRRCTARYAVDPARPWWGVSPPRLG